MRIEEYNHPPESELGWLTAAAAAAPGIIKGGSSIVKGVKGIFGGRDSNAGTSSLVDILDNYEALPTNAANQIAPKIQQMIQNGASEFEIAQVMAAAGGEPNNASGWMSSSKWNYMRNYINQSRQSQNGSYNSGSAAGINPNLLIGAGLIGASGLAYALTRKKK